MTFSTSVPVGAVTIAGNKPKFVANFTAMNTAFSADHSAFASATNIGLHKQVSFIGVKPAAAVPVTTEGITVVAEYMPNIALEERRRYALFYRQTSAAHADASYQLTGTQVPLNNLNGYSNLPGGLMIQWGITPINVPGLGTLSVNFNTNFDTDQVTVTITPIREGGTSGSGLFIYYNALDPHPLQVFKDKFTIINRSPVANQCFWMAIGPRA